MAEQATELVTQKLIVFGKEFELSNPMSGADIRQNLVSIVKELDPEAGEQLETKDFEVRNENGAVVVYRDAHFG